MATVTRQGWFRRSAPPEPRLRALTASATRLNLRDRKQTRQMRVLRQGWQEDAWGYYDSIGELRYATEFLANCTARMKLFPAAYPQGGEEDNPVPLAEVSGAPEQVVSACAQAMADLGNGKLAIRDILHSASTNKTIAGEMFLLGRQDPETGKETWSIRSVDELVIYEDKYKLREAPVDPQGILGWIDLDPQLTVISRIWQSHPRFRILAISPLRSILDDCESLLIHRRTIRAVGRSRLAGPGVLLVPEELGIKQSTDDDPDADPVMRKIMEGMMEPIAEEGTAASVVPIMIRGPGETLEKVKLIEFAKLLDPNSSAVREELVGVIATGLDLPKEVVLGVSDLNHWSAWQVDDNTFRHHVEPHVIGVCDGLTGAFLQPYLRSLGISEYWVQRCLFWYDPTELVTHPDRAADAEKAYAAMTISAKAYRAATGFSDEDAPTIEELEMRRVMDIRALPLNLLMEYARRADPSLIVPPMTGPPELPGIKPGGVDIPPTAAGASAPTTPTAPVDPPAPPDTATPGPPSPDRPLPAPITASGGGQHVRLSRKLAQIDRDLRSKLQTAANAALLRQLERVGAKLRTKVAKDETLRTRIAHRPNERVSAILGQEAVTAAGFHEAVPDDGWSAFRTQFYDWTSAAQQQAIITARRLGGLEEGSDAVVTAEAEMAANRDKAWELLSAALTGLGHNLMYSPDPNVGPGDWADMNPDTIVPTGTIRAALGVAGGGDLGLDTAGNATITLGQPIGQIGTGSTVENLLTSAGVTQTGYEWIHGPSLKSFEPHEELDGFDFESFDSEALANTSGWPDNQYYFPGDHQGCTCDFVPLYGPSEGGEE